MFTIFPRCNLSLSSTRRRNKNTILLKCYPTSTLKTRCFSNGWMANIMVEDDAIGSKEDEVDDEELGKALPLKEQTQNYETQVDQIL